MPDRADRPAVPGKTDAPAPVRTQRIVLTGFMGSGKSTVGRLLARQLRWKFIDADAEIERSAGATIAEVFESHGESWFRTLEHETISKILSSGQLILALGGGAIEHTGTRELLLNDQSTRLIHLEASLQTVLKRCQGTDAIRPVLADRANLQARYERRLPLYRQAHLTIPVDFISPYTAASMVLARLGFK